MTAVLPSRQEVDIKDTWDLESIFSDHAEWVSALSKVTESFPALRSYKGRLGESSAVLLGFLEESSRIRILADNVSLYANLLYDSDTTNQNAGTMVEQSQAMWSELSATLAYSNPELLLLEEKRVDELLSEEPKLESYRHFFRSLFRLKSHVRNEEVEEILALASEPLSTPEAVYQRINDTDLVFKAIAGQRDTIEVSQGTIEDLLREKDREIRKLAWENYSDGYLGFKNTYTAILSGSIKDSAFRAKVRGYGSSLEASLHKNNVPISVFETTISTCRKYYPLWHCYWEARRHFLGLDSLEAFDVFVPLSDDPPKVSYDRAVEIILAGMEPLGEEYTGPLRQGLMSGRWVDVYPNKGKRSNAYSSGSYTAKPFILMNYSENFQEMSVLAHELGHSMHSYLTHAHQPYHYSHPSLFVAEVASNFNQAMIRTHLAKQELTRPFKLALIDEALSNFHRYLFIMPILAQFERETHRRVEAGQGLSADYAIGLMSDLFQEGYGPSVTIDRERVGMTWAQFGHLYSEFYVFQYATGIAAANALAERILTAENSATEKYLSFLKAGSSLYPLDALRLAGIDMTSSEPLEAAFRVLRGFIERLEDLVLSGSS